MNDHDRHAIAAMKHVGSPITAVELDYQLRRHNRPGAGRAAATLQRLEAAGIATRSPATGGGDAWAVNPTSRVT